MVSILQGEKKGSPVAMTQTPDNPTLSDNQQHGIQYSILYAEALDRTKECHHITGCRQLLLAGNKPSGKMYFAIKRLSILFKNYHPINVSKLTWIDASYHTVEQMSFFPGQADMN